MTQKKVFAKKIKKRYQTQNFTLFSNPLKKERNARKKKSYKQNKFDIHE